MKHLLALDAHGKTGGVCILRNGAAIYHKTLDEGLTHSQTLLLRVQGALAAASLTPADVDCYAVTGGPGSFTGLRIGMALVKGLALPGQTPAVAVSTLEAMAFAANRALCAQNQAGRVLCALNARRGEVYWAAFDCDGTVRRLSPDAAAPAADAAAFMDEGSGRPYFVVGDGAHLCYNDSAFGSLCLPGPAEPLPVALGAALAAHGRQAGPAGMLRPVYLRQSQAERERNRNTISSPG